MSTLLFSRPHFGLVRRRTLVALAIVGTATALYGLVHWQAARARAAQDQALQQLHAVQAELAQIRVSDPEMEASLRRYRALVGDGFVGDGDRLAWSEALLDEQRALGLPPLRFELAARRPLAGGPDPSMDPAVAPGTPPAPGAQVHDLTFEIAGIHEGELLALIERLRARRLGHFRVQACELRRGQAAGLEAACTLRWITYLSATAATGAAP